MFLINKFLWKKLLEKSQKSKLLISYQILAIFFKKEFVLNLIKDYDKTADNHV